MGTDSKRIVDEVRRILDGKVKLGKCPQLWDGHAAERIIEVLVALGSVERRM